MNFNMEAWQPIIIALIGAAVPSIVSAALAWHGDKKTEQIKTRVNDLGTTAERHSRKLDQIGVAVNGERDALIAQIQKLRRELDNRPDGT